MTEFNQEAYPTAQTRGHEATSPLLADLLAESVAGDTRQEWRREGPRKDALTGARLELRKRNGTVYKVRLHNVSVDGLCVICPHEVRCFESVFLRRSGATGPFERFIVRHVTSTVGGFKLGMIPEQ